MQLANNESDTTAVNELNDVKSCIVADEVMDIDDAEVSWMDAMDCLDVEVKVAIIDAMAIVQGIKKTPTMKKMSDFRLVFCKKIQRRAKNYSETRVVFNEYLDQSLKENTRVKRAKGKGKKTVVQMHYQINENMSLAAVQLKELLSSTKTKRSLTKFLADGLLSQFEGNLIVVQGCMTRSNNCPVSPDVATHSHEEADTVVPLPLSFHVLDALCDNSMKSVDVHCGDADIIMLLMDLVAHDRYGEGKVSVEKVGNFSGKSRVDIVERVAALGKEKAKCLVGFHNFTGADWGGKLFGITKETWMKAFLRLADDDDVISCFQRLGSLSLSTENHKK